MQIGHLIFLETVGCYRDPIGAGGQSQHFVLARRVRISFALNGLGRVDNCHVSTRDRGTAFVHHGSTDRGCSRLRPCARGPDKNYQTRSQNIALHRTPPHGLLLSHTPTSNRFVFVCWWTAPIRDKYYAALCRVST